ncbi:hypothetical protein GCM10009838_22540 [Catenulispora subtropica]|uniref:Secreted protein n=1 Tax=Catenulispora subtropica TaxID=450798 RepID=A0ABN2R737_9ACTN
MGLSVCSWNRMRRALASAGVWAAAAALGVVPASADGPVTEYGPLPSMPVSGVCETHFDSA